MLSPPAKITQKVKHGLLLIYLGLILTVNVNS